VPDDEREAIAALCARLALAQRLAVVKGLLPELRLPLPTRREIAWGSLVYLLALLAPLALLVASNPSVLLDALR